MNYRVRITFLLLCALLASVPARAQMKQTPSHHTEIHGVVRDAVTHTPLYHVLVRLEGQGFDTQAQTDTDQAGKFDFQNPGQQVFMVHVRQRGYKETIQQVDLTMATTEYVMFDLQPDRKDVPAALPPEGPQAGLNARDAAVPESARKEFAAGKDLLLEKKDPPKSIEHLRKAVSLHHPYYDAYMMLGMAYLEDAKPADAKSSLEKAIQLEPKLPDAHIALGILLSHEKDYPAAEKSLSRGLELNPQATAAEYELAKTYFAMGKVEDAEPHATNVATTHPEFPPIHVLLGNIHLRKRDNGGAVREFKEYLRLDPSGPMAEQTRTFVNKLESSSAASNK